MEWLRDALAAVESSRPLSWVAAIVVLLLGVALGKAVRLLIRRLAHSGGTLESAVSIGARITQSVVVALAAVLALGLVGVNIGAVLASAGVAGLIVGFALKDVIENYLAGVILAFRRAFLIGDEIIVATEYTGRVEELSLRYIRLRTRDGLRIYLPNALLLKEPLVNLTRNGSRRGEFEIGVAFETDLDQAREVAITAAAAVDGVTDDKDPQAWVSEFGSSTITILVRFWYDPDASNKGVRSAAMVAVKDAFDRHGIRMPAEQVAVHMDRAPQAFAADPGD